MAQPFLAKHGVEDAQAALHDWVASSEFEQDMGKVVAIVKETLGELARKNPQETKKKKRKWSLRKSKDKVCALTVDAIAKLSIERKHVEMVARGEFDELLEKLFGDIVAHAIVATTDKFRLLLLRPGQLQ